MQLKVVKAGFELVKIFNATSSFRSIGTYWIASYVNRNNATYFDRFAVEHIRKEIKTFIGNKNIVRNIYRI